MSSIAIFYGSTTGNTESVATRLAELYRLVNDSVKAEQFNAHVINPSV